MEPLGLVGFSAQGTEEVIVTEVTHEDAAVCSAADRAREWTKEIAGPDAGVVRVRRR